MSSIKNVSLAEEHLHDHFASEAGADPLPVMPASLMIEGMAQTAGILVGAAGRFREKVVLAKIAQATFQCEVSPGETIRYDAVLERIDASGASTAGTVRRLRHESREGGEGAQRGEDGWETIGRVDLMFSHLDRNMAGMEFPEENFVFSDNFRVLLASAGLEHLIPR
jgi:3-hydroxyacyl-[acyl-carrier-protein] dehydratase